MVGTGCWLWGQTGRVPIPDTAVVCQGSQRARLGSSVGMALGSAEELVTALPTLVTLHTSPEADAQSSVHRIPHLACRGT